MKFGISNRFRTLLLDSLVVVLLEDSLFYFNKVFFTNNSYLEEQIVQKEDVREMMWKKQQVEKEGFYQIDSKELREILLYLHLLLLLVFLLGLIYLVPYLKLC